MDQFAAFYLAHTFWFWLSLGAILLALEAALGTEWLLWLATSAGLVALLSLTPLDLGPGVEVGIFAAVTLALTFAAQRFMGRPAGAPDVNDNVRRMLGATGTVTVSFERGEGRVLVGGSEWPARAGDDPTSGERVVVDAVDGSMLIVRRSS